MINSEDVLFELIDYKKINADFIIWLNNSKIKKYSEEHREQLFNGIFEYIRNLTLGPKTTIALLSILKENSAINNDIFNVIIKSLDKIEKSLVVEYINSLNNLSESYFEQLNTLLMVGNFNDTIIAKFNKCKQIIRK